MSILSKTVDALSQIDQLKGVVKAFDTVIKSDIALNVTATAGRLTAEVSTGVITIAVLRPILSRIRLGSCSKQFPSISNLLQYFISDYIEKIK